MTKTKDPLESRFYPIILKHLASRGYVTHSYRQDGSELPFIARGQGQLIVDVYGLKGGKEIRTTHIESAAVEVKRKQTNTPLRYIAQAQQYSRLAHRCYLAQPFEFTQPTLSLAAHVGVGLLQIHEQKREVELVAESKIFEPDPDAFASFLNRSLRISQCAICHCFQFRYGPVGSNAIPGGGHWRTDHTIYTRQSHNKLVFLCAACEGHWASAQSLIKLQRKVGELEKRLNRLKASHSKLKAKI